MVSRKKTRASTSPERLAETYLAGPAVVYVRAASGDYATVHMSAAVEALLGWSPDDFLGEPGFWADHIHPDDRAAVLDGLAALGEQGGQVCEYRFAHRDGSWRWIRDRLTLNRAAGEISGCWDDITEYRDAVADLRSRHADAEARLAEMIEELAVARDEAQATDRAKAEFLSTMSHELRTPLNAIIGFSDILRSAAYGPLGDERYGAHANDINQSGQHLLDLVNDVLDLSKIESGGIELTETDIAVADIVEATLALVRDRAKRGGVDLVVDVPGDLPFLYADARKLKQIFLNLMSNAIKFTNSGGTVVFKGWCRDDSGYVFQVSDTGIGIALEDIPKALSTFGQVDGELSRKYEGSGLGLPLAKRLAELHGGSLDLQSAVGVGTTVTVRLPAERIRAARPALQQRSA